MDDTKYKDLIAKIQRKRKVVIAVTIILALAILLFATPTEIEVLG